MTGREIYVFKSKISHFVRDDNSFVLDLDVMPCFEGAEGVLFF